MVKFTHNDLEFELKKRNWEQYLDLIVLELESGRNMKGILKDIVRKL